jgi:uncharacterized protein with GYD domain
MPFYLVQAARYTADAWNRLVRNPEDRIAAVREFCARCGGQLHHFFFAFGEHDLVELIEAPDNKAMMAIMMAAAAVGTQSVLKTTVLVDSADAAAAMAIAGEGVKSYVMPGQGPGKA